MSGLESLKRRRPEHAGGRLLDESRLADEGRRDPMAGPGERACRWRIERARPLLDGLEPIPQVARQRVCESGADAAAVDQPLAVVASDEQRAKPVLRSFLIGESADHEQAASEALDLPPAVATPRADTAGRGAWR